jgi:hypothetical protein
MPIGRHGQSIFLLAGGIEKSHSSVDSTHFYFHIADVPDKLHECFLPGDNTLDSDTRNAGPGIQAHENIFQ